MKALLIDDEPVNLELLEAYMQEGGYQTIQALDGKRGWESLSEHPDVSLILLDKMMPNMSGIEFLQLIKTNKEFKDIPVIMQTALADANSVKEGLEAGVYYYLTKPFNKEILLAIANAAVSDARSRREMASGMKQDQRSLALLQFASFEYKSMDEAQGIAQLLARGTPDPDKTMLGISEMLMNAVEHGNLGIGFAKKSKLLSEGKLLEEIQNRLTLPEYSSKIVRVTFERSDENITISVEDQGKGFDWQQFWDIAPERASAPNGRGIMMSRMISFDEVTYLDGGRKVVCKINLD